MRFNLLCALMLLLLSPQLYSVDLKISFKDQSENIIATDSVAKMIFATDRTRALIIQQKNGSDINAVLTDIKNLTFSRATRVKNMQSAGISVSTTFVLHQNYPNPFNGNTMIEYELSCPGWITVQIYNISGQLLRNLESRFCDSGLYRTQWNGENDTHQLLATGLYFVHVKFNDAVQVTKLLLLK
jgi:hypothetical protein